MQDISSPRSTQEPLTVIQRVAHHFMTPKVTELPRRSEESALSEYDRRFREVSEYRASIMTPAELAYLARSTPLR